MKGNLLKKLTAGALALIMAGTALPQGSDLTGLFSGSVITASAASVYGDFEYEVITGKVWINKYKGSAANVTIPDSIIGYPVAAIGAGAFGVEIDSSLKTVTVPSTLEIIDGGAFYGRRGLTTISGLGNTKLSYIGKEAFSSCRSLKLTYADLPSTLKQIGDYAFSDCQSITSVRMDSVTSIGNHAFAWCSKLQSLYGMDKSTISAIPAYAFFHCDKLTGSDMLKGMTNLKSIGERAFAGCDALDDLYIPPEVTTLGNRFYGFDSYEVAGNIDTGWKDPAYSPNKTLVAYSTHTAVESYIGSNSNVNWNKLTCSHTYTDETIKAPTCTQSGTKRRTCTTCLYFYDETLDPLGHDIPHDAAHTAGKLDPTPLKAGWADYYCKRCDGKLTGGTERVTLPKANMRIAGDSRYHTAMETAYRLKIERGDKPFENFIICDGRNFADALSASYLAKVMDAPILLVAPGYEDIVSLFIFANGAEKESNVIVVGGEGAVSEKIYKKLETVSTSIRRIAGKNRYETSELVIMNAAVAVGLRGESIGQSIGYTIIIADGRNYADALSASATGKPVLLVNGGAKGLTDEQKELIAGFKQYVTGFAVAGGEGAVNKAIEKEIAAVKPIERIAGSNRYETSVEIAKKFFTSPAALTIATGTNFPDGLSAGPLGCATNCPLILAAKGRGASAKAYAKDKNVKTAWILGGTAVVSDKAVKEILG